MKRPTQLIVAAFGAAGMAVLVGFRHPPNPLVGHPDALQATRTSLSAGSSSPTSTSVPTSVSGEVMPVGDLPGWNQVFADDFVTNVALGSFPNAVRARWGDSYPDGWQDTTRNGTYAPSKVVSIAGGVMNLHLHTENGVHMVAAPVPTIVRAGGPKRGLRYGRYVVRFRADPLPGYKTAWLLWPDSENWPGDGEIDFPEGNLDGPIKAFVHPQGGTSGAHSDRFVTTAMYTSWHTAVIERTADRIVFLLDGKVVGIATDHIPNTPMHWVLQTETALTGPPPTDATDGNVQIDWVTAYTHSAGGAAPITRLVATRTAARVARSLVVPRIPALLAKGGVGMTIDAPGAGTVLARLTAKSSTRTVVLGTRRVRLMRSGKKAFRVPLTRAARMLLKGRTTTLRAKLTVTYTTGPVMGTAARVIVFRPALRLTPHDRHAFS